MRLVGILVLRPGIELKLDSQGIPTAYLFY